MKQLKQVKSLSEQAFTLLQKAIIDNILEPGKLYSATEIGQWIGVSRTPIREAALQLEKIGLVKIEKNRGIRIVVTSLETLVESFQMRLMLEVPIMRQVTKNKTAKDVKKIQALYERFKVAAETGDPLATLKADRDYHLGLLHIANIPRVIDIIEASRNSVLMAGPSTVPISRSCMEAFEDHVAMHQAFISGDSEKAASEMRNHIINTAILLIKQEATTRTNWSESDISSKLYWIKS